MATYTTRGAWRAAQGAGENSVLRWKRDLTTLATDATWKNSDTTHAVSPDDGTIVTDADFEVRNSAAAPTTLGPLNGSGILFNQPGGAAVDWYDINQHWPGGAHIRIPLADLFGAPDPEADVWVVTEWHADLESLEDKTWPGLTVGISNGTSEHARAERGALNGSAGVSRDTSYSTGQTGLTDTDFWLAVRISSGAFSARYGTGSAPAVFNGSGTWLGSVNVANTDVMDAPFPLSAGYLVLCNTANQGTAFEATLKSLAAYEIEA